MATLTLAAAQSKLVGRRRGWIVLCNLSAVADGTANPDLDDPMGEALIEMGLVPIGLTVADADLSTLAPGRQREFLARAELRLLRSLLGSWTRPSQQIGPQSRLEWRDIKEAMVAAIKDADAAIVAEFGIGSGTEIGVADVTLPSRWCRPWPCADPDTCPT